MNNKTLMGVAITAALLLNGCTTTGKAGLHASNSKNRLVAHSIIFTSVPQPVIVEKKFTTQLETLVRSDLRSYRFSNYISGKDKPDFIVTLALSGRSAGLGIYNSDNVPLVEYPSGKAFINMAEFEMRSENGSTKIRWYLGEKKILSIFESYDAKGMLGVSENTIYLLK